MVMNHQKLAKIYSISKIMTKIELGDSLTDVQMKTGLSFTTVRKGIDFLENKKIIKTSRKTTHRGKARQCIYLSDEHRKVSELIVLIIDKSNNFIFEGNLNKPLLFEAIIRDKTIQAIEKELRKESSNLEHYFSNWIKSSEKTFKLNNQPIMSTLKEELNDLVDINDGALYFNPEKINIKIKVDSKKKLPQKKKVRKLDLMNYSKEK
jgi:DNA-binding PadR family transcriptional regulator